jgi:hypothetical protein
LAFLCTLVVTWAQATQICWNIDQSSLSICPSAAGLRTEDPLFCEPAGGDFGLCADSPAVEGGEAIYGAFGVACAECSQTPVVNKSWGGIKKLFGGRGATADSDTVGHAD